LVLNEKLSKDAIVDTMAALFLCSMLTRILLFREHAKKFREEDMQIRLDGKNCLVTGANSGIGFATAEGLASRGATVYMLCRNKERGETALSQIRSKTGNMNVHLEICDLSSISEVKSFATKFSSTDKPLHVLVNNAGLLEHKRVTTPEGCVILCCLLCSIYSPLVTFVLTKPDILFAFITYPFILKIKKVGAQFRCECSSNIHFNRASNATVGESST
jgi:hypothetical protein